MEPPDWSWGPGGNLLIGSDQVAVGCQVVLASWRELLRPVDDGRLDEAAAAQPEEGGQVPQHAQTAAGNKQTNKQIAKMATTKSGQQSKNLKYFTTRIEWNALEKNSYL